MSTLLELLSVKIATVVFGVTVVVVTGSDEISLLTCCCGSSVAVDCDGVVSGVSTGTFVGVVSAGADVDDGDVVTALLSGCC